MWRYWSCSTTKWSESDTTECAFAKSRYFCLQPKRNKWKLEGKHFNELCCDIQTLCTGSAYMYRSMHCLIGISCRVHLEPIHTYQYNIHCIYMHEYIRTFFNFVFKNWTSLAQPRWYNTLLCDMLSSSYKLHQFNLPKIRWGKIRLTQVPLELNPVRPSRLLTRSHNEFFGERGWSGGVWHPPVCPRELWLPLDTSWMHRPAMQRYKSPQCNGSTNVAGFIFSTWREKKGG